MHAPLLMNGISLEPFMMHTHPFSSLGAGEGEMKKCWAGELLHL
jgi:hypothetical protein